MKRWTDAGWILLPAAILTSISLGQGLAAILAGAWFLARDRVRFRWPGGLRRPLLAFYGWILFASFAAGLAIPDLRDALGKWMCVMLIPLAYTQRLDARQVRRALLLLAAAALAMLPRFLERYGFADGRAEAFSGGAPNLGTNTMLAILVLTTLGVTVPARRGEPARGWYLAGALIFGGVLGLTLNRGALLGAAAGLAWLAARRSPAILLAGLLAVTFGMAAFPHSRPVERLRSVVRWHESFSSQERTHMWWSGLNMIRDRPLLGFSNRRNFIIWYNTKYRDPMSLETVPGHVHNSAIQTAVLHGVPGLGLLLWWLAALWRIGMRTGDLVPILLIGTCLNAQVDFTVADGQRAMLLYTLIGLLLGGYSTASFPRRARPPHSATHR